MPETLTPTDTLLTALAAIDRLNSWVRSESARHWMHSPKRLIYHQKRRAIADAHAAGLAAHRHVAVIVECRRCNERGHYIDWEGRDRGPCWTCGGSHKVALHFIETVINEYRWHTPYEPGSTFLPGLTFGSPESTDFQPNTPGKDLSLPEVAEALNLIETRWPVRSLERWVSYSRDGWDGATTDDARYKLYLGESTPGVCCLCGAKADTLRCHTSRGCVEWIAHCCTACESGHTRWARRAYHATDRNGVLHRHRHYGWNSNPRCWEAFPVPIEPLRHPAVREWMARHWDTRTTCPRCRKVQEFVGWSGDRLADWCSACGRQRTDPVPDHQGPEMHPTNRPRRWRRVYTVPF